MKATYDPEADAAYVEIVPDLKSMGTEEVAPGILLDHVPSGDAWAVIGIELLKPTPRPSLARIAAEHGFAHLLDDIYAVLDSVLSVRLSPPARQGFTSVWIKDST